MGFAVKPVGDFLDGLQVPHCSLGDKLLGDSTQGRAILPRFFERNVERIAKGLLFAAA